MTQGVDIPAELSLVSAFPCQHRVKLIFLPSRVTDVNRFLGKFKPIFSQQRYVRNPICNKLWDFQRFHHDIGWRKVLFGQRKWRGWRGHVTNRGLIVAHTHVPTICLLWTPYKALPLFITGFAIWMKFISMRSMYKQSGTHRHFHWRIVAVLTQNPTVLLFVDITGAPKL